MNLQATDTLKRLGDIDVLEIDGATHTQIDNVREVIISGLSTAPARDRFKIFIIDEVHQLSNHAFNALLKSIEEPPPHVVFMMATTQLEKIPETIRSRSQVHELRTISRQEIATQLRKIADAESINIDEGAVDLVSRAADGSMRDAQSALDQVRAFAGDSIGVDDVSAVLGLIGRETVFELMDAVAAEEPAVIFDLAGRFVELGYDLRLVCRELARVLRGGQVPLPPGPPSRTSRRSKIRKEHADPRMVGGRDILSRPFGGRKGPLHVGLPRGHPYLPHQ